MRIAQRVPKKRAQWAAYFRRSHRDASDSAGPQLILIDGVRRPFRAATASGGAVVCGDLTGFLPDSNALGIPRRYVRWRPDAMPRACSNEQVDKPSEATDESHTGWIDRRQRDLRRRPSEHD
jgi:hypothetical protein